MQITKCSHYHATIKGIRLTHFSLISITLSAIFCGVYGGIWVKWCNTAEKIGNDFEVGNEIFVLEVKIMILW